LHSDNKAASEIKPAVCDLTAQNKDYRSFIRTQIRCAGKVFEGFTIGQKSQILLSLIHNFTAGKVK
jgi:hypothetical protein